MYHRIAYPDVDPWSLCVSPKYFSEQLEVLRRVGYPYTIGNLVRDYVSGNVRKNAFVVTFDDGYLDNLAVAKPLLEAHDIPATMFVCSGAICRKEEFWWDQLTRAFLCLTKEPPKQLVLDAAGKRLSWDFAAAQSTQKNWGSSNSEPNQITATSNYIAVYNALRPLPAAALEQCMRQIREWAAIPNEARPAYRTLNSDQLVALASSGLIDIGAHTVSHPLLPAHPYAIQRQEIVDSKFQLQDIIQRPIEHFAYPYGQYDQSTVRILHETGFSSACTTATIPMKRYELPRMQVENWSGERFLEIVQEKLSG